MKKLWAFFLVAAAGLMMLSGARAESTTTVMIYMCGSNLESQYGLASQDIGEMIDAQFDLSYTNVVLMLSGTQAENGWFSGDRTTICEIGRRGFRVMESHDAMNMAETGTLAYFLNYASAHYDSERYILILWDHGGGPLRGVCWDETYSPDNLTMQELLSALKSSPFTQRKLDMIGFDACLMSSLEVAWMVAPYAAYMTASEATEPGSGWDYSFLNGLENDGTMLDTGRRIVDGYMAGAPEGGDDLTLACVDLSEVGAAVDAMSSFFSDMLGNVTQKTFANLSLARRTSHDFGRTLRADVSAGYDLVDLRSLLDQHAAYSPEKRDAAMAAMERAVAYSRSNMEGSSGLSVYFPYYNAAMYRETGGSLYESLDFCPGYTAYMKRFGAYLLGEDFADWAGIMTQAESTGQGELITAQLTAQQLENFASAQLVVLESHQLSGSVNEWYRQIYDTIDVTLDGEGRLSSTYRNERIVLASLYSDDGSFYVENEISLSYEVLDSGEYVIEALASNVYGDAGSAWAEASAAYEATGNYGDARRVRLIFSPPDEEGFLHLRQTYVYDALTGEYTTRAGFRLRDYDFLYIRDAERYPVRGENGAMPSYSQWPTERLDATGETNRETILISHRIYEQEEPRLRVVQSPTGTWRFAAFQITDTQNHVYLTELVPLENREMVVAEAEVELAPSRTMELAPYCLIINGAKVMLHVQVTNRMMMPLWVELEVTAVNGRPILDVSGRASVSDYSIGSGETVDLFADIYGFEFGNDPRMTSIGFRVRAREVNWGLTMDTAEGLMRMDEDISTLHGRIVSHVFEPDALTADSPCLWDDEGARVWLNTVMVTHNGAILALTCENEAGEDKTLYLSEALLDGEWASFQVQRNKTIDGSVGFSDAYDAYTVTREYFDTLIIPAGARATTYIELVRVNGSGLSSLSGLGLCLNSDAARHEQIAIVLPHQTALDGSLPRWAGHALQVTAVSASATHAEHRLDGEVLMPENAGQYSRPVQTPLTPEQAEDVTMGHAWVGRLVNDRGTTLLDPLWHITYMWYQDGKIYWAYPGLYLAIGSGSYWEPLFVEEIADGWQIPEDVFYFSGNDTVLIADMMTGTLSYEQFSDTAWISFDGTPQTFRPGTRWLYPVHKIYQLPPMDGSIHPGRIGIYPTRFNSDLDSFFDKSEGITVYPIRLAMRPYDREEPLYVLYSFCNSDGTWWSTDPIPLDP